MSLKEFIFPSKEEKQERKVRFIEDRARELYQLREFNGQLWLTYNDFLICPSDMLKQDPIEALACIRDYYVQRNTEKV